MQDNSAVAVTKQKQKYVGTCNTSCNLVAAKYIYKKSVFCLSNAATNMSCEDIKSYVSSLNIDTLSCFEVKTRFEGTKSFRLCIKSEDKEKLVVASTLPKGIIVREWVWKSKAVS